MVIVKIHQIEINIQSNEFGIETPASFGRESNFPERSEWFLKHTQVNPDHSDLN